MSQYFEMHPCNPQKRLVLQAVAILQNGGVAAFPTDASYSLGCHLGDKRALDQLRRIRRLSDKHHLTLMCQDLSEIATYAKITNSDYRLLKSLTPGPYTFLLSATHEVPRRVLQAKKRTIGIRVVDHPVMRAILDELGQPLLSTTLHLEDDEYPLIDGYDIRERLENQLELVIDTGENCTIETTTVIDLTGDQPYVVRQGLGVDHGLPVQE